MRCYNVKWELRLSDSKTRIGRRKGTAHKHPEDLDLLGKERDVLGAASGKVLGERWNLDPEAAAGKRLMKAKLCQRR